MSQAELSPVRVAAIAHIVLFVKDPEASAQWYCEILNMSISARAGDGPYKGGVFLSFGVHDHDIALFPATTPDEKGREFEHIGLRLAADSVEDLRRIYAFFLDKDVKIAELGAGQHEIRVRRVRAEGPKAAIGGRIELHWRPGRASVA